MAEQVISLSNELQALRENICISCKERLLAPTPVQTPIFWQTIWRRHPANSPTVPTWSVETLHGTALHVTFARSLVHKSRIRSVRFSPDGKHLAALLRSSTTHTTGPILFFDLESGEQTCTLIEHTLPKKKPNILCMSFGPNPRYLVVGDTAGRITVWDVPNRRIRNVFRNHTNSIESVDFSPDGRLVASASGDKTVRIWNIRDGSSFRVFSDSPQGLWSVKFSPDSQSVVAGNSAGLLMLWHLRTGRLLHKWSAHRRVVLNVAFTPEGQGLVSGSGDGLVKYWDIGPSSPREILEYRAHTSIIKSIAISSDAQWVASASYDKTAIVWDLRSAVRQCTLVGHQDAVVSVDFSPLKPYIVTGSQDGQLTLWRYS